MAKHELLYWDYDGRGEPIRMAFLAGDVEFTDTRIPMADEKFMKWQKEGIKGFPIFWLFQGFLLARILKFLSFFF